MLYRNVAHFVASGFQPRVTIIGTGPAGLSLVLRLQERGVPSLLIEAGGAAYNDAGQDCFRGTLLSDSHYELHMVRARQFGGSSAHWSGWCRALDAVDFEPRAHVPHSGWPIARSDLDPQAAAAARILQIGEAASDVALTRDMDEVEIRFSPPVRLGPAWFSHVQRSSSIGLLLDTAVTELVPVAGHIDSLRVVGPDGAPRMLPVRRLCLAAGGIENSRLLLWSNARHRGGTVPHAETLGRYWMGHNVLRAADALLAPSAEARFGPRRFYAVSPAAMAANGIAQVRAWIPHLDSGDDLARGLVRDALCVAPKLFDRAFAAAGRELRCGAWVRLSCEQLPQRDNRIELDRDAVDRFGVPRARVHCYRGDLERRTAFIGTRLLGEALIRHGLGRLRITRWLLHGEGWPTNAPDDGRHHIGGTRMADSPARGVVDRDCKVFGVDNLWIGGSSVFATSGHAQPTTTIVQLALRLGDHLAALEQAGNVTVREPSQPPQPAR